jgi:ubiquitin carboxyl-terminal hydrolase 4/11/15
MTLMSLQRAPLILWYEPSLFNAADANVLLFKNANAYLLFYRRRTNSALGGKSFLKIQETKLQPKAELNGDPDVTIDTQLPTPPNEKADYTSNGGPFLSDPTGRRDDRWTLRSGESNAGSSVPSPPNTDDHLDFDDYQPEIFGPYNDPLSISTQRYDFPEASGKASPTSSNEADADIDTDLDRDAEWASTVRTDFTVEVDEVHFGRGRGRTHGTEWEDAVSNGASPSYSELSDSDPFSDTNVPQKFSGDEPMDANSHDPETTA